ncbi:anti-sigma factor [Bacillus salacetis]|uniref:Anti-sigma factor n=1 Tax=Bacillus salacetis TaxID=2315464 RepID=A0A3A1R1H4_9BACI|nr:anti-sigma factor [Bacillus salacetis]RIW34023.1 anti-sigma factor [Bacillus salacetis]
MSEEWRKKLQEYYEGSLSEEEADEVEKELEKLEIYQDIMADEMGAAEPEKDVLPPEKIGEILKGSVRNARFSLIAYVTMILLLIYPFMTMMSYIYYGWGGRANELIDVAAQTIYVTEPNVSLEEMDVEEKVGLFSLDVYMDLYKRVGKKDINLGDWTVSYDLDSPDFPERNYITENPPDDIPYFDSKKLYHPDSTISNSDNDPWGTLKKLPEGTVAEVYISLNQLREPADMPELTEDADVEWRWYAIDTGLEAKGKSLEGGYLPPIGYPAQTDPDAWSPYHSEKPNEEQFMDSLKFLEKYEEQAVKISHGKWLDLDYRIKHLEANGLYSYGGVLTGPVKEILKLKDNDSVRQIQIGEVRLWNW